MITKASHPRVMSPGNGYRCPAGPRAATGSAWTRGISRQETTFPIAAGPWPVLGGSAGMRAARREVEPTDAPAAQAGDQPVPGT